MQIKIEVSKNGKRWFTIYQTTTLLHKEISSLVNNLLMRVQEENEVRQTEKP